MAVKRRWKKIILGASLLIAAGVVVQGSYYVSSQPNFCITCHEVKPYVSSWQVSAHREVTCLSCHEPRGPLGGIHSKSRGLNYALQHISDNFTVPTSAIIPEGNCIACHTGDMKAPVKGNLPPNTSKVNHYDVIRNNESCLDCHRNVGHEVNIFVNPSMKKTWKSTD